MPIIVLTSFGVSEAPALCTLFAEFRVAPALSTVDGHAPNREHSLRHVETCQQANFNGKFDEIRKKWGGGIMGSKSQSKTKARDKLLAKEAAQRI
ncbi:60S ribosomal protein L7a [Ananas comosus]|uniref:60S ribosomal protein L7a n=1 Tax=Ananas comosus TaxID=4615 RepID=A0A199VIF2_ANACO|nr:60S ribosomal protein L7a [Ananas comosus]